MGIWGDIGGTIGNIGIELGKEYIRSRYTPQPDIYYPSPTQQQLPQIPAGPPTQAGMIPYMPVSHTPPIPGEYGVYSVGDLPAPIDAPGMACQQNFKPSKGASYSAMKFIVQPHPRTGSLHYWQHVGLPDHFTGYKGIVKSERRLAAKAATGTRKRRSRKR